MRRRRGGAGPVGGQAVSGFGALLRRVRAEAGLTQEELAEAARLSPRSVSDLERGINRTARRETARLLADALGLTGPARAQFEAAARGRPVPGGAGTGGVAAATRMLPAGAVPRQLPIGVGFFVGRERELKALDELLDRGGAGPVPVVAVGGMAGVGKTALAVYWARRIADRFPDGQLYVNLRGFDPDGAPVTAEAVTGWFLAALGVPAAAVPGLVGAWVYVGWGLVGGGVEVCAGWVEAAHVPRGDVGHLLLIAEVH